MSVNPRLTRAKRRQERETGEFLDMLRRMVRAAGRRVAEADEVELGQLIAIRSDLDAAIDTAVQGMRARGLSWAYIASATGTTKQAAFKRWGRTT
jgi:hypothetical protein